MKKTFYVVTPLLAVLLVAAVLFFPSLKPIRSCDAVGAARPLCGWQNPEDLAPLPDGRHVVVSEYGGQSGEQAGTLALLDLETETRRALYRGESAAEADAAGAMAAARAKAATGADVWGDPDCPGAPGPAFSPHGIDLSRRADGRMQLLAVQHGGRESVEWFEVAASPDTWTLTWRGCAVAPEGSMLNDVVATPEGGFLATHMMPKRRSAPRQFVEYMKSSLLSTDSGYVLTWRPGEGFGRLAGSAGGVPNGIAISPDGATVFVNYSAGGELRRIDRRSGRVEASNDALPPLDNATWAPDGRLLVAGALAGALEMMPCVSLDAGSCPGAFAIIAVDPETLESKTVYEGGLGTPSGAGTVGLQMPDGTLLIGTFAGDRIVRVAPQ